MKTLTTPSFCVSVRRSSARGHSDLDWLDSRHTFSFANYYDSQHMGYRSLRVINEDRVAPMEGFGSHHHRDMEILTYVVSGSLRHRDSMGHELILTAGMVQKITAGRGINHSEFNASDSESVHFLQIWIQPARKGLIPSYEERTLPAQDFRMPLQLIGAADGEAGGIVFHQDVCVYRGRLNQGQATPYYLPRGRGLWAQVISGELDVVGTTLHAGDGAIIEGDGQLGFLALADAEFLLFDLA